MCLLLCRQVVSLLSSSVCVLAKCAITIPKAIICYVYCYLWVCVCGLRFPAYLVFMQDVACLLVLCDCLLIIFVFLCYSSQ